MKKAVVIGAGNVGRGFIGKTLSESGYGVCFLDVDEKIIDALNKNRGYTVKIVSNESETPVRVKNVRAVSSMSESAPDEIAACDIMATSVGVRVLPHIAGTIAEGVKRRIKAGGAPLNVILAENQIGADTLMRGYIYEHLNGEEQKWADKNLGLAEASIGRMIPPLSQEQREADPLLIAVEPYDELPVDKAAFKGEIPEINGLIPFEPFEFYITRKLFVHNMGHAVCAYLGNLAGYAYIWEAIADPHIEQTVRGAMYESAKALSEEFGVPEDALRAHADNLISRFANRRLADTVLRVGADPVRKLRKDDRLVGAALLCEKHGIEPKNIAKGIAAALKFSPEQDPRAAEIRRALTERGVDFVIEEYMGANPNGQTAKLIKENL